MILLHTCVLLALIWLGDCVFDLAQDVNNPRLVVIIGLGMGFNVGLIFHNSLQAILSALSRFRTERLLVQYFSQIQSNAENENAKLQPDT